MSNPNDAGRLELNALLPRRKWLKIDVVCGRLITRKEVHATDGNPELIHMKNGMFF